MYAPHGGVPEWLNGAVSKTVVRVTPVPRVRIPPPPPCDVSGHVSHMSRDIGLISWSPASGRALCFGCASSSCWAGCGGRRATSPVVRSATVIWWSSANARRVCGRGRCRSRGGACGRRGGSSCGLWGRVGVVAQGGSGWGVSAAGGGGLGGGAVDVARGAPVQRSVRAVLVVVARNSSSCRCSSGSVRAGPGAQPALQGLVEPLGLALGLRVSRGSVLLPDTEHRAAGIRTRCGRHRSGRCRRGRCRSACSLERRDRRWRQGTWRRRIAADGLVRGAGQQKPGVVIEPVEDLHIGPVLEAPVDEVRLQSRSVGHLKARVGASAGACAAAGRSARPGRGSG